jgi:hypothetical protein
MPTVLDCPCCLLDCCLINDLEDPPADGYVDTSHCKSGFSHTVVYECCFAEAGFALRVCGYGKDPQYVRLVRVAQSWQSPAVCRVVHKGAWGLTPVAANKIDRTLESAVEVKAAAKGGNEDEKSVIKRKKPDQKNAWKTMPEAGDTVVVHHGPCCHWTCNRVICPCWHSGQPKLIAGNAIREHRLMASSGL